MIKMPKLKGHEQTWLTSSWLPGKPDGRMRLEPALSHGEISQVCA